MEWRISRPTSVGLMLLQEIRSSTLPPSATAVTQVLPGNIIKAASFFSPLTEVTVADITELFEGRGSFTGKQIFPLRLSERRF